ncbi:MAG: RNA polymerase-associated protein RapA [Verrucomicrobiota bacterium]
MGTLLQHKAQQLLPFILGVLAGERGQGLLHILYPVLLLLGRGTGGWCVYRSNGAEIPEALLASNLISAAAGPEGKLRRNEADESHEFDLRLETMQRRADYRQLPQRGLIGARVDLIPHQLFIANEVVSRKSPRVLLADETGLGKTIEAGHILHQQLLSGRASRVLIVTPESLTHQWFFELLRRFNIAFTLMKQDYCEAFQDDNAFASTQTGLVSIELLTSSPKLLADAVEAEWDLLIVDEAHHLAWQPNDPSPEYQAIEQLAAKTEGLLLLTATPRQLGEEGHFARLRLLDPARHADFEAYERENEQLPAIARAAETLAKGENLTEKQLEAFLQQLPEDVRDDIEMRLEQAATDESMRDQLVQELVDRHGIGRVMFRNARAALEGHFPARKSHPAPLDAPNDGTLEAIQAEFDADLAGERYEEYSYSEDPRIDWLVDLLGKLDDQKAILISSNRGKAEAIVDELTDRGIDAGEFHEDLELIERDRNAAMFADTAGQQLLVCSEIGSEGRNFQFVQHLILWDIPINPAILEQRIGRLDRIGQAGDVNIHVPYVCNSAQELLFHWHHEGLSGVENSQHGGEAYLARFGNRVRDLAKRMDKAAPVEIKALVDESKKFRKQVLKKLEDGRDRLHELASCRPAAAEKLVDSIAEVDADPLLEDYAIRLFEWLGWAAERLENRAYVVEHDREDAAVLPFLKGEGSSLTFRRSRALEREDWQLMTWDHPAVREAMEYVARNEGGTASLADWDDLGVRWVLECIFILEPLAPPALNADRFLPPKPVRIVVAYDGKDETDTYSVEDVRYGVRPAKTGRRLPKRLSKALGSATEYAQAKAAAEIETALGRLDGLFEKELDRLEELRDRNRLVSDQEADALEEEREELRSAIADTQPRLDSIRVIYAAS